MPNPRLNLIRHEFDPTAHMRRIVDMGPMSLAAEHPFRLQLPWEKLSVFCRHYGTSEALAKVPYFCIAQLGFTQLPEIARRKRAEALEGDGQPDLEAALAPLRPYAKFLTYPLGQVVTDHSGYASFDLAPLHQEGVLGRLVEEFGGLSGELAAADDGEISEVLNGQKPELGIVHLWVLPFVDMTLAIDALVQGDVSPNFITLRVELSSADLENRTRDRPGAAMQTPSILDWRLSPSSFTMSSATILGEDGCETLLPTNLSTQQFRFSQVIRGPRDPDLRGGRNFRFAHVVDYASEWFPIGHSLGQILYSLPLAPGEKVKIAIVDWARQELAKRDEKTNFMEQLQHSQLRDRTLTEAVHAAVREWQTGDSIMGGAALSGGASVPLGVVDMGVGTAMSIGAASASTTGTRDITGETTQRISDAFQQASSAVRELKSTVVVQSDQAEKSNVQTRVIANYNRGHALTMLYYEVLRHYRVITRTARIRPALLVKYEGEPPLGMSGGSISADFLIGKRHLLEPRLLDDRHAGSFTAATRVALGEAKLAREMTKWNGTAATVTPGDREFVKLVAQFTTGDDDSSEPVFVVLHLNDGRAFEFQCNDAADEGSSPEFEHGLPVPVRWSQVKGVEVKLKDVNSGGDWEVTNITINLVTAGNERTNIVARSQNDLLDDDNGSTGLIPVQAPPPSFITHTGPQPQRMDFVLAEDDYAVSSLIKHIEQNRGYYVRVMRLSEDPNQRVAWMENLSFDGKPLLDLIENKPLEMFGDFVAYAVNPDFEARLRELFPGAIVDDDASMSYIEQLMTLPTRGVFGEAKLGHCDAAERIDTDRFTDWQQSVLPDDAPEITGADAGPRGTTPAGLVPSPFPQSIVNIANPQALPDPTGLGGAFGVLSALGPFKDLSGQKELGSLLQTLSNNATSLASQGLKAASTKRLMDMIQSAPGLKANEKRDLTLGLLGGAVQSENKPCVCPPTGGGTSGGGTGTGTGTAPALAPEPAQALAQRLPPVEAEVVVAAAAVAVAVGGGGGGGGGGIKPKTDNPVKPEQNKGRIFILSFMRSHRSDPQVLNNVEMVGYKDWTGPIDITHSEWRYTAADIPDAGTAKVNCTYKAVVFNKALLEQAIRQQVEADEAVAARRVGAEPGRQTDRGSTGPDRWRSHPGSGGQVPARRRRKVVASEGARADAGAGRESGRVSHRGGAYLLGHRHLEVRGSITYRDARSHAQEG